MRKKAGAGLGMLLLLCLLAVSGDAAGFSLTAEYDMDGLTLSVRSRYVNDKYALYLPGNWDLTKVKVTLSGHEHIRVGETEIRSGEVSDLSGCLGVRQPMFNARGGRMGGTLTILQGSGIPSVHLTLRRRDLNAIHADKKNRVTEGSLVYTEADGTVSYSGPVAEIKGRGNSTYRYAKKPYQVKLPVKCSLSGMGRGKTWIFLANWLDLSQLRNRVMLELARQVGLPYALSSVFTDVYINGEYYGLYLMTEKIQVGKDRVDIRDLEEETEAVNDTPVNEARHFKETGTEGLNMLRGYEIAHDPEDITGGYILEIEKSYRFKEKIPNGFRTRNGLSVTVKEPTFASRAQVTYIGKLVSDFHKAVLSPDGVSPDTGIGYAERIDMTSFALKWWLEEISKNYDAFGSSQYYVKDADSRDGRLKAGPVWDYDLSMGNMYADNFVYGSIPARNYVAVHSSKTDNLYRALYAHGDFRACLERVWRERVRPALALLMGEREPEEGDTMVSFDTARELIEASASMNALRWPESLVKGYYRKSGTTHEASADYLRDFLLKRTEYLDSAWAEGAPAIEP